MSVYDNTAHVIIRHPLPHDSRSSLSAMTGVSTNFDSADCMSHRALERGQHIKLTVSGKANEIMVALVHISADRRLWRSFSKYLHQVSRAISLCDCLNPDLVYSLVDWRSFGFDLLLKLPCFSRTRDCCLSEGYASVSDIRFALALRPFCIDNALAGKG